MSEQHSWVDSLGNPWTPSSESDRCIRCGRTPDAHRPDCGTSLGTRMVKVADGLRWTLHRCSKPAIVKGQDGLMRCVQHDRMFHGLPGKWTNAEAQS